MKNEFVLAFNELIEERQLSREVIIESLEAAMVSAYRRSVNASSAQNIEAHVDSDTGRISIFAEKEVVDEITNDKTEVLLSVALLVDENAEVGGTVMVDSTPENFGRVAAQTARQVIQQRMRDAERQEQKLYFEDQVGEIISGVVQAVNSGGLTIGMEKRAEGILARKDQIPGERFRVYDRVRTLIAEVKDHPRGPQIVLSRTHSDFLRRLLENEVPEIYHGIVEIRSIAREPGRRAKVAVMATQSGIDPVGACVGMRGVRIQAIVRELHNEKIDVIEWNEDPREFIAKAISPAKVVGVYVAEQQEGQRNRTATVVVKEDQLSLAIGRDGQNARLAARLTGWRIDIKSLSEASAGLLYRLEKDEKYASIAEEEHDVIVEMEAIMAKKAENLALTSEEFAKMIRFVDRVEGKIYELLNPKYTPEQEARLAEIRASLPEELFAQSILDSSLPEHVQYSLQEVGYGTTGDMILHLLFDKEKLMGIKGMGPRAQASMEELAEKILHPEVEEAVEEIAEEIAIEEVVEEETASAEDIEEHESDQAVEDSEKSDDDAALNVEAEVVEEEDFDELFEVNLQEIEVNEQEIEDEESGDKKPKKKGRKNVKLEFDPELGKVVAKHKHKKGKDDWDEWGEDW
ncbi:MAG: transcription termination factor NusA [Anaerolineaceae bacterium]|nr:transcription termination factor NusA [Anaerolineaceae bacterium]